MSEVIDQRVVEMEFDNDRFERNMATTTKSLERFKKTLTFDGATKGFENIDAASKKVDFTSICAALETVKGRFAALEVAAATVLVNITNMAFNAGKRIVESLTITPIIDGFQEYEMVLNAVQTTMAGTGKTAQEVQKELSRLDDYADNTIYSTRDMLTSLPKFTNAGVELTPAITAMIGIANATALAGGNAQQAASAFYNMGQSIGTGYLTRMDYNSLNLAGTATMEWKNQMVNAAIAAGTLTKSEDGLYKIGKKTFTLQSLFIDGLQEQWATTGVLMKVFGDYGDVTTEIGRKAWAAAQDIKTFSQMMETLKAAAGTGWNKTWQIMFGDLGEAKRLWTGLGTFIGDFINSANNARNEVLTKWKDLGGRTFLIEGIKLAFKGLLSVLTPIKEAFLEIFPPNALSVLMKMTRSFFELTKKFKLGDEASNNLKRTFKGLFAFISIIGSAFKALGKFISPIFNLLLKFGGGLLEVTAKIGDFWVKVDELVKSGDIFGTIADKIILFAKNAKKAIKDFFASLKEKFKSPGFEKFHEFLQKIGSKISEVFEKLSDFKIGIIGVFREMGESLKKSKFYDFFVKVWEFIKLMAQAIGKLFSSVISGLGQLLGNADYNTLFTVINGFIKGGIGLAIFDFIRTLTSSVKDGFGIGDKIKDLFGGLNDCLGSLQKSLDSKTLIRIAIAVAILAGSLLLISFIDSDKLGQSLGVITALFTELMITFAAFNNVVGNKGVGKASTAMIAISVALLILASALKVIGDLSFEKAMTGLLAVTILLGEILLFIKLMNKESSGVLKGATQMVIFALALKILASVLVDLSTLSWEQVAIGLAAIGGLLLEMVLFSNLVEGGKGILSASIAMIALGISMKILASALAELGSMDLEVIKQGLKGLAWALGIVTIALNMIPNGTIGMGIGLILVATAMLILAKAIEKIGAINYNELNNALKTLGWALGIITLALNLIPDNTFAIGAGLVVVSLALLILANVIEKIGAIPYNNLNNAIKTLAWSLGLLTVALILMEGTTSGALALLIAVAALNALVPVLTVLGAMSWDAIIKSLVALAGAFVIIGVAGLLLKPIIGSILGLGIAIGMIGLGLVGVGLGLIAIGAGLSLVALGITALAGSLAVGATAIVAAIGAIIIGLIGLIPQIIDEISLIFTAFLEMIIVQAPLIAEAIKTVILESIKGFGEITPVLIETLLSLVDELLASLVEHTPSIVDSIFKFLIGVIDGIAKNLPDLIEAGVGLLMSLLTGVVDALGGLDPATMAKGVGGILILSSIMLALAALALLVPLAMIGVLGFGLVISELALVLAGIGALSKIPGLSDFIADGGDFLEVVGTAIGKFIGGIAGGIASGVTGQFPQIGTDLSTFMSNAQPFLDGAKQIDSSVVDGVTSLAEAVVALTAANLFEGVASWLTGSSSMVAFGEELAKFGPYFKTFYESISGVDSTVVANATNAANALAAFASNIPNAGGVVGWFTGENSLSAFADELVKFGPKLKTYADSVSGLDSSVVTNSANAASALSEFAKSLPNSGGVVGWFTGENSLSAFADELVKFGPAIKEYASSVTGLDSNVIVNSTNAAKAVSELAKNLPNSGGAVSLFTGDNDMSDFGEGLVIFGQKMVEYAESVKGLDSTVIADSTKAASSLIQLQNGISKEGGLFSSDSDLKDFGKGLASFGKKMSDYYLSVKDIDTGKLSPVIGETYRLVSLIKSMNGIDSDGPSSFSASLSSLAKTALEGFINTFTNSSTTVFTALSTFFSNLQNGISQKKAPLIEEFTTLNTDMLNVFTSSYPQFVTVGEKLISMLISGLGFKIDALKFKAGQVVASAVSKLNESYSGAYEAGKDFVRGFTNAIGDHTLWAAIKAMAMARAALEAAREYIDSHSPSKKTYELGTYFVLGFANAIGDGVKLVYSTAKGLASAALDGASSILSKISDAVNSELDYDPTITPVLDLSKVTSGASKLSSLLSMDRAISVAGSIGQDKSKVSGLTSGGKSIEISFEQTINAPKDPNPVEIYRLTKNLISITKDVVKA